MNNLVVSLAEDVTQEATFTFDSGYDSLSTFKKNVDSVTLTLLNSFPRKSLKANNDIFKPIAINKH
ncbi:hypothetical protein [cyanobacterium endosymbiont of Rhopalodia gibberula]|uniref:hypothetical protein n=1 Tax=cyanobacterium endosymbiont of Rhopalodia gibberula TaxID=1763363 RepID=UPI000E64B716|nr:hypothetical protein [cyanobacterium endosymbiont of Rhopalodia gibberula]